MEHAALADRLYGPPPTPSPAPEAGRGTPGAAASASVAPVPGTPPPPDTPTAPAPATGEQAQAPRVEVPEAVKALRAESAADADDPAMAPTVTAVADFFGPLGDTALPADMRQAVEVEATQMTRDLGLDAQGLQELLTRGAQVQAVETTPEQDRASRVEAIALLRSEFGDGHKQALADARKLVNRDPRVAQLLKTSNLGNDPQTVLQFARLAARQRATGRLK